jgi:hypothetical protein
MTTFAKLRITALLALALVGLVTGVVWGGAATLVSIDDLTDTPSVTILFGSPPLPTPTILPDTAGEFLHFTLPAFFLSSSGTTFYSDLFEDVVGGTLSDRLLVTYVANSSIVDVQFASDPATIALPPGASNFVSLVENGAFQQVGFFQVYAFQVRSDRADVPAPATLLLLGSGLAALGGATWRRCRRA